MCECSVGALRNYCTGLSSGALMLGLVVLGSSPVRAADRPGISQAIKVDQVGYLPNAAKIALVTTHGDGFVVRRASDGSKAMEGKLGAAVFDHDTGDTVAAADF